jgi:hypothetical protein
MWIAQEAFPLGDGNLRTCSSTHASPGATWRLYEESLGRGDTSARSSNDLVFTWSGQEHALIPILVKRECEEWIGKTNGERKCRYETDNEPTMRAAFFIAHACLFDTELNG